MIKYFLYFHIKNLFNEKQCGTFSLFALNILNLVGSNDFLVMGPQTHKHQFQSKYMNFEKYIK